VSSRSTVEIGDIAAERARRGPAIIKTDAHGRELYEPDGAAVALYVAHYNLCRVHEALRTTPAKAIGVADRAWTIAQLVDAALAVAPALPTETPPDRRRKFEVIQGAKG
jgi:hypothetical protein